MWTAAKHLAKVLSTQIKPLFPPQWLQSCPANQPVLFSLRLPSAAIVCSLYKSLIVACAKWMEAGGTPHSNSLSRDMLCSHPAWELSKRFHYEVPEDCRLGNVDGGRWNPKSRALWRY